MEGSNDTIGNAVVIGKQTYMFVFLCVIYLFMLYLATLLAIHSMQRRAMGRVVKGELLIT
jgi:hypothetical protein